MSTPTRQLPRSERQETILRGAALAFAQGGYAATSMEDIAAASGITKLIVYRHFESKQDLYQAVLQRVSDRLFEEFRARAEEAEPDEQVVVRTVLTIAREDPDAFRLLFRHAAREPQFAAYVQEYRERSVAGTMSRLASAISDPVLLRWAAETRVSFIVEALLRWLDDGDPALDDEFVRMTAALMRAMTGAWSS